MQAQNKARGTRVKNETRFLISKKGVTLDKGRHQNCAISGTRISGNKIKLDRILYSSELIPVGRASILNEAILVRRYG